MTNSGWPSFYIEEMTEHAASCQAMVTSLIVEGVFEQFPSLKIVLIEAGFAWLPALGWRLDKHWKRLRDEVPHLKRAPSEYLREHFWVSTQPMEETEKPEHLLDVMDWIGWDKILFASDYPHWDFDDPVLALPPSLDETRRRKNLFGQRESPLRICLMPQKHVVAAVDEIKPGARKLARIGNRDVVIFNLDGEFFAISDRCPHKGASLCIGTPHRTRGIVGARRLSLFAAGGDYPLFLGMAGNLTCAPVSPGAIRASCARAITPLR